MTIVEVYPRADAQYGLIKRKYRNDPETLAQLELAYHSLIIELRIAHPSIWLLPSDDNRDIFVLYYPPLQAHFRKIHDQKIGVVGFVEIEPLDPAAPLASEVSE